MAYENRLSKLQVQAQSDLLWFTCKVMPAVQKKYKPLRVDEHHQDYYHVVTPSDEAFGFFCLKNYKEFTSFSKWKKEKKMGDGGEDDDDEESKTRKEKLCGRKLMKAVGEYDDWHRKFMEIRKNKNCLLSKDINQYCRRLKNKSKEKVILAEYGEDSLDLGMMSVRMN